MLSSYPVSCPYEGCGWGGNLVPSLLRGGADAEIGRMQRAWFRCPSCQRDWEVRISGDRVSVVPAAERMPGLGEKRNAARRKDSVPLARTPDTQVCSQCGFANNTAGMKTLRVEMRPVLTTEVFAFPDALAEVNCMKCAGCGHWICLDYRIELDDNPEIDLNPE